MSRAADASSAAEDSARSADALPLSLSPLEQRASPILRRYSEGLITRRVAMDALGLPPNAYPAFVDLMATSASAWPRIDRARIDREAEIVVEAIRDARDEN